MKQTDRCISCGKTLLKRGYTTFPCPNCDTIIGRCSSCREQSVKYTCSKCSFTGP
ncbi:MAG: zinc finger domain-containing protein [Candidatus Thermoplasmatota archaeon]